MKTGRPKLEIVDEGGNVIGEETRERIHAEGLLHKEVHVWFYTPENELIFQHRRKGAETYPDLLDATVGGHVEIGDTIGATALKETAEETGVNVCAQDIHLVHTMRNMSRDAATGRINNVIRPLYLYEFTGALNTLRIEPGHGAGFEKFSFDQLNNLAERERGRFVPTVILEEVPLVLKYLT